MNKKNPFQPTAKVIADSINPDGDRLTTFVCTYHRFIHQEVLTHRMFSRNSSSSRAIPVKKMIEKVNSENVQPLFWGRNQPGMTAKAEHNAPVISPFSDYRTIIEYSREEAWEEAKTNALTMAEVFADAGYHKQIVNRLLEPFSSITTVITATEYANFFKQRCHPNAQPEIQALAIAMMESYQESKPRKLAFGEWHIPFISVVDIESGLSQKSLIKVAVGRCARVSYLNHDGERNPAQDIELHNRLVSEKPPHLSPLEHVAIAEKGVFANFTGFKSYRYQKEH